MRPPTPLPEQLQGRPFLVAEAIALEVSRKRLRSRDLRAPFHGVRVCAALGWNAALRARCGVLVTPPGTLVVGYDAVAVAQLPLPCSDDELLSVPLIVAPPFSLDPPQTKGLLVDRMPVPRTVPRTAQEGVLRPSDADLWAQIASRRSHAHADARAVFLPPASHAYAVRLGRAVLERLDGEALPMLEALHRLTPPLRLRARPVLDGVLERSPRSWLAG